MCNKTIIEEILSAAIQAKKTENADKKTKFREEAKRVGEILHATYLGFQDAGFTPEQAFELTLAMKD